MSPGKFNPPSRDKGSAASFFMIPCSKPPEGWSCTRESDHGGPCAAVPTKFLAEPGYQGALKPRARSPNQAVGTPPELLNAVVERFGRIEWDLAANKENAVCPMFFGPGSPVEIEDALDESKLELASRTWPQKRLWLNPPFENIAPWAVRCARWVRESRTGLILFLVPASVGSNWWEESVRGRARVLALAPRIKFVGHEPYPKDMVLCVYDPVWPKQPETVEYWRWKK